MVLGKLCRNENQANNPKQKALKVFLWRHFELEMHSANSPFGYAYPQGVK